MPLSKVRNRERMRQARLHAKEAMGVVQPKLYNPAKHRPGDIVLVQRGKRFQTVTIPKLDADGNPMPDYY